MRARILVVEDEAIVATDLRESLEDFGYEVVGVCRSGEEAIEKARVLKPDAVLMDIHLADEVDGTEAARSIRRESDASIIYLTAFDDPDTFESAQDASPQAYLVKPYEEGTLRTTIETVLRRRQEGQRDARRLRIQDELLAHLTDAVLVARPDGTVEQQNPAARALFGDVASLADVPDDVDAATPGPGAVGAKPGSGSGGAWAALLASSPRQWLVGGAVYTVSATPVEDAVVVIVTPGSDVGRHRHRADAALTTIQRRARQLI